MDLFQNLSGVAELEYTCADPVFVLQAFRNQGIELYNTKPVDKLTLIMSVSSADIQEIVRFAESRGESVKIRRRRGGVNILGRLRRRWFLILAMMLILIIGCLIPGRILFVSVEGNETVASQAVIEAAEYAGLKFGTPRKDIRSEQIKNYLLDSISELRWAGVNTYGCRAVITVKEKQVAQQPQPFSLQHIVATSDGIITSLTVLEGTGMCSPGTAVKRGELLISGYTDCGISIRASAAKGTVMAETGRSITAITPTNCLNRVKETSVRQKYSLIIGKKRINFYKGSGISGGSCVKMCSEYVLTLPGGFQLPIKLVKETVAVYQVQDASVSDPGRLLKDSAEDYLYRQMNNGSIIDEKVSYAAEQNRMIFYGTYACEENIGTTMHEQIGEQNG